MISRLLCAAALSLGAVTAFAADVPKDSPFGQAAASGTAAQPDTIQFAGVSTLGSKAIVNLYDTREKRSFWVENGKTVDGVTVVSYDSAHDQITVRVNGVEKTLPLRAASAVVNGPGTPMPVMAPVEPAPAMSASPAASDPSTAAATSTATTSLSQARQEEEARMLVSDLLEIGMAQRKAYEEAKRKQAEQAAGQQPAPSPIDQSAQPAAAQPGQTAAQPAATGPATAPTGS